jgi:hypothetical protein
VDMTRKIVGSDPRIALIPVSRHQFPVSFDELSTVLRNPPP